MQFVSTANNRKAIKASGGVCTHCGTLRNIPLTGNECNFSSNRSTVEMHNAAICVEGPDKS